MSDPYAAGFVDAPIRARLAQIGLFLHVAATGLMHAMQPVVRALYGAGGYHEDGAGLDVITHGLFSLVVFLLGLAVVAIAVLAPVAVLAWLHRASKNAHAIATQPLEHSPGMAIGWWFVPIANLWQPLAVVREIETASDPEGSAVSSPDTSWWWGTYILGNLLGFAVGDTIHPSSVTMVAGALATVAHAISAFMLVRIISRIHTRQRQSAVRRRWADVFEDDDPSVRREEPASEPATL